MAATHVIADLSTRLAVEAFLEDLWEGTDIDIALKKAGLVLILKRDDQPALLSILDVATAKSVVVREGFGSQPFDAVSIETLQQIVNVWME